jgi:RNA polymerase sigma-70 factor, ECF subfamily
MPACYAPSNPTFEVDALPWREDVYRFALSLTRDESDADDVVQDTFLRAYRSWHTFVPGTDCRRWLFTICRNAFLRSRERLWYRMEIDEGERDATVPEVSNDQFEELFVRLDVNSALERALRRVPEPFRSALVLVDVEDQSYETAAEVLGVPVGTVRSRLFRGRRLMQELLQAHALDAGLARAS